MIKPRTDLEVSGPLTVKDLLLNDVSNNPPDSPVSLDKITLSIPFIALHLNACKSQADIARLTGHSPQWVNEFIQKNKDELEVLSNKDGLLALHSKYIAVKGMKELHKELDRSGKKNIIALNAVIGTHIDKYRLLSDQSTENISMKAMILTQISLDDKLSKLLNSVKD